MEKLTVTDMHTGGEPLRIVTSGYPPLPKGTILQKRAYVRDNLDHLRKILMFEPRGHHDMYGALLVEPDLSGADLAVLFMHNEGYSTMCGHAVIALGRYAVERGLVAVREPVTRVNIECPCGMVIADVEVKDGKAGNVSFESVPAFLFARDIELDLGDFGPVIFDIAYGGAFYCLIEAAQFGLEFGVSAIRDFTDAADALTLAAKGIALSHPDSADLAFLYGTIITDGGNGKVSPNTQCLRLCRPRGGPLTHRLGRHRKARRHACQGRSRHWRTAHLRECHWRALHGRSCADGTARPA